MFHVTLNEENIHSDNHHFVSELIAQFEHKTFLIFGCRRHKRGIMLCCVVIFAFVRNRHSHCMNIVVLYYCRIILKSRCLHMSKDNSNRIPIFGLRNINGPFVQIKLLPLS